MRIIKISVLALLMLFAAYCGGWFYASTIIDRGIDGAYEAARDAGLIIQGERPKIAGFPGAHKITFSGVISRGDVSVHIPSASLRGYFLPGQKVALRLEDGFSLAHIASPALWSAKKLEVDAVIPNPLPRDFKERTMLAWRDAGGKLDISRFAVEKEFLKAYGPAVITLDAKAQPAMSATLRLTGYIEFLSWLQSEDYIQDREALIAGTVMAALSQEMPDGTRYVDLPLSLQNRYFFAGPLRLAEIDEIHWD